MLLVICADHCVGRSSAITSQLSDELAGHPTVCGSRAAGITAHARLSYRSVTGLRASPTSLVFRRFSRSESPDSATCTEDALDVCYCRRASPMDHD